MEETRKENAKRFENALLEYIERHTKDTAASLCQMRG